MFSVDFSTCERDGHIVIALRGELDLVDAADVAAALAAAAARAPEIIVDLADLAFIDSSGVAALAYGRRQARRAGGELVLTAPRQHVLKILTITRLADAFSVYASVDEAASGDGRSRPVAAPASRRLSRIHGRPSAMRSGTASGAERGSPESAGSTGRWRNPVPALGMKQVIRTAGHICRHERQDTP